MEYVKKSKNCVVANAMDGMLAIIQVCYDSLSEYMRNIDQQSTPKTHEITNILLKTVSILRSFSQLVDMWKDTIFGFDPTAAMRKERQYLAVGYAIKQYRSLLVDVLKKLMYEPDKYGVLSTIPYHLYRLPHECSNDISNILDMLIKIIMQLSLILNENFPDIDNFNDQEWDKPKDRG